jgi:capsular exopolysaccharide synthesis family protein
MYKAQASVVVQPPGTTGGLQQGPDMATEKGIVSSNVVLNIAARQLHLQAAQLFNGLSAAAPGSTYLLNISYTSPDPRTAQQRAQAIAEAYVAYRTPPKPAPVTITKGKKTVIPPVVITTPTATLITPASLPTSPSSPKKTLDYGVAILLGLSVGIGTAALRDRLSDRLRGPADLESRTAKPLLGLIPAFWRAGRKPTGRLVMIRQPESVVADAYRALRTRLVQAGAARGARTLIVTGPAREDKDAVAANLAVALAQSGHSAILVCADLRWGQAYRLLGVESNEGLVGVLDRRAFLDNVLIPAAVPGLEVLPAGGPPLDTSAVLQRPAFRTILGVLIDRADFVVITAPPVLAGADAQILADLADMTLVVADARRSTRAQVRTAMRELAPVHDKIVGCVFTGVGRRRLLWRPRSLIHAGNGLPTGHDGPTGSDEPAYHGDESDSHQASADPAQGQTLTATTDRATTDAPRHRKGRIAND